MFPNYKKSLFFTVEDGWQDLGQIQERNVVNNNKDIVIRELCAVSKDIIHIGRENGKIFKFCPRCLETKDQ